MRLLVLILFTSLLSAPAFATKNKMPTTKTKSKPKIHLLSAKQFYKMPVAKQDKYISKIQDIYIAIEKKQKSNFERKKTANLFSFIPEAYASDWCIVGGVQRSKNSAGKCPVYGNGCEGPAESSISSNFKCGPIFGNVCVAIPEDLSISNACKEAAAVDPYPAQIKESYPKIKEEIEKHLSQSCAPGDISNPDGCDNMQAQLNSIDPNAATTGTPGAGTPTAPGTGGTPEATPDYENCMKETQVNETASCINFPAKIKVDGASFDGKATLGLDRYDDTFSITTDEFTRTYRKDTGNTNVCMTLTVPKDKVKAFNDEFNADLNTKLGKNPGDKLSVSDFLSTDKIIETLRKRLDLRIIKYGQCPQKKCPEHDIIAACNIQAACGYKNDVYDFIKFSNFIDELEKMTDTGIAAAGDEFIKKCKDSLRSENMKPVISRPDVCTIEHIQKLKKDYGRPKRARKSTDFATTVDIFEKRFTTFAKELSKTNPPTDVQCLKSRLTECNSAISATYGESADSLSSQLRCDLDTLESNSPLKTIYNNGSKIGTVEIDNSKSSLKVASSYGGKSLDVKFNENNTRTINYSNDRSVANGNIEVPVMCTPSPAIEERKDSQDIVGKIIVPGSDKDNCKGFIVKDYNEKNFGDTRGRTVKAQ